MTTDSPPRRLRWGMIGGGRGAFIGDAHRMAARIDDGYDLVAGVLSSDPERALASALDCRIAPERSYGSFEAMAEAEAARPDGVEVVSVVTPNNSHHAICRAFLDRGIHVICDKPLATTLADALDLVEAERRTGLLLGLTHNYTGYPMIRHARRLVADGAIGRVRLVQAEFAIGWLSTRAELEGNKQAEWRTDPARSGPSGVVIDIGTHTSNLAEFITGLETESVSADLTTFLPGRRLEDNAHILARYRGGARGMHWLSMVAAGESVGLRLRVYGETGHLAWNQSYPDDLHLSPLDGAPQVLKRGTKLSPDAKAANRLVAGLPEGYLEAFANLYGGYADLIWSQRDGRAPAASSLLVPRAAAGAAGLAFVEAALESARRDGAWVPLRLPAAITG